MSIPNISFEALVDLCLPSSLPTYLWDVPGGNKVIQIPNTSLAVKFGRGVTQAEAQSQQNAATTIDPTKIRIPQVFNFFHDGSQNIGYIVMEFVEGKPIDVNSIEQIDGLRKALDHLSSMKRSFPGPLHSGELQGILWEDDAPKTHDTAESLGDWINMWQDDEVNLVDEDFVLCHLDTALQNMLWLSNGQVCLLDWGSAGYYPRYFELAAHQKKGRPDGIVEKILMSPQKPFSDKENHHKTALIRACGNAMMNAKPGRTPALIAAVPRRYLINQPDIPHQSTLRSSVNI